jgi:hypothetical protein
MYIHDERCRASFTEKIRTRFRKDKPLSKDVGFCLFYWPGQNNKSNMYEVSEDPLLQSVWHYYILSISSVDSLFDEKEYNPITGKVRLGVFQKLAASDSFEMKGKDNLKCRNSRLLIFQNIVSETDNKNIVNILSFPSG